MLQHFLFCLLIYLTIKVHMTEQSIIDLLTLGEKNIKRQMDYFTFSQISIFFSKMQTTYDTDV